MIRYCVQRLNAEAKRFEWLASDPPEDALLRGDDLDWTADSARAADLGAERAQEVLPFVAGASFVRFGDAPIEETIDFAQRERDRAAEARAKRLGEKVTEALQAVDIEAAHAAIALMSDEERAKWAAPMAEQDAAADLESARRSESFLQGRS